MDYMKPTWKKYVQLRPYEKSLGFHILVALLKKQQSKLEQDHEFFGARWDSGLESYVANLVLEWNVLWKIIIQGKKSFIYQVTAYSLLYTTQLQEIVSFYW